MTRPVVTAGRSRAAAEMTPLLVAGVAAAAVCLWLLVRSGDGVLLGYCGGPVALVAAVYGCWKIGSSIMVDRPVRAFWRANGLSCIHVSRCNAWDI